MAVRDDDEGAASPREQAEAARLARLTDALLDGEPLPPAMDAEHRLLLETVQVVRSGRPLDASRRDALVDEALRRRRSRPRLAAWIAAGAAAAAALILALRPLPDAGLAADLRSRPADRLVGRIDPSSAADGRARADLVYADRLAAYRRLVLSGAKP